MSRYEQVQTELRAAPRKWLVTGVAGFIGSHLLEKLLQLDQEVVGLDNFATGKRENLAEVQSLVTPGQWQRFRMIEGDICDLATCHTACAGVDFVLHQAALGSVPRSLNDPIRSHQSNVDGFLNMLVAARDAKVQRFVYASSSSVYGDHPALPKVEANIGQPLSPYAATKLICETYAQVFTRCYQLPTTGLRYFNVFGPRQDPNGAYAAVIPRWFAALLRGEEIVINGDGETSRDFCYVANVVQANLLAAASNDHAPAPVFNIALSERTTLNTLIKQLQDLVPKSCALPTSAVTHRAERSGDVRHSLADISQARNAIGYSPSHSLGRGLAEAGGWYATRLLSPISV